MCGDLARICADRFGRAADRHAGDAHPRNHRFAGGEVAELEQLLQHLPGVRADGAELLALLDDQLQLLRRVVLLGVLLARG